MKKAMFNDEVGLTDAVIAKTKDLTRRVIPSKILHQFGVNRHTFEARKRDLVEASPWKIGEILAVAQPYSRILNWREDAPKDLAQHAGFSNKMFVDPELMPHRICITGVRVEQLQDITDEDCAREGIEFEPERPVAPFGFYGQAYITRQGTMKQRSWWFATPRDAFRKLIEKVCGKGTWEENPYVYVYEFKLIRR